MRRICLFGFMAACLPAAAAMAQTVEPGPIAPGKEGELAKLVAPQPGQRACYARSYTQEHLKQHLKQTVTELGFRLAYIEHEPEEDIPQGQRNYYFELKAKLRNRAKPLITLGECMPAKDAIECFVDCDGGGVRARRRDGDQLLVDFGAFWGIRMSDACGEADGEEEAFELKPGRDDKEFLLTKAPAADCPAYEEWDSNR